MDKNLFMIKANRPLSIYVHLPWCVKKCPYCDFNSHVYKPENANQSQLPEQEYIEALALDLQESNAPYNLFFLVAAPQVYFLARLLIRF
jgi:coproporphyrinogen III oxidase-like Fe-S oxidoreductase